MGVTFFYLAVLSEAELNLLPSLSLLFYPTYILFRLADTYKAQKLYISITKPAFHLQLCSLYLPAALSFSPPLLLSSYMVFGHVLWAVITADCV